MKKKLGISILLIVATVVLASSFAWADEPASTQATVTDETFALSLAGAPIDVPAYWSNGALYLPLRAVCEKLGGTVSWQAKDNCVVVKNAGAAETVQINLEDETVTKGDHSYYIWGSVYSEGCRYFNGRLYLEAELFTGTFPLGVRTDKADKSADLTLYVPNDIRITTMKINSDNDDITINVRYPQIDGLTNYDAQNAINATLRQTAVGAIDVGMAFAYDLRMVKEQYPDFSNKCDTDFDYLIQYNHDGILSVVLYDYQYSGGAHGGTAQICYTFDLKTGKILQLADLMQSGSGYKATIDRQVRSQIDERVEAGFLYELDAFSTIGEEPEYYLSNNGVVIYFQEYEYFPYAAGIQAFTIPFGELSPYLLTGLHLSSGDVVRMNPGETATVEVGDIVRVVLTGNPTTGYDWQYTVGDPEVLAITGQAYIADSGLIGAGGTYTWDFKVLKAGETKIVFKYFRPWEGTANVPADNIKTFSVTSK